MGGRFFDSRRARVRPHYAYLYPEVVPGVWLSALKVTGLLRRRGLPAVCRREQCNRGRVLCDIHFEFRGSVPVSESLAAAWRERRRFC